MKKSLTVIIPVLDETAVINNCISHLRSIDNGVLKEIIVVDGGSRASTLAVIDDTQAIRFASPPGRAVQMNRGAAMAAGDFLLFLHADTLLPAAAFNIIVETLEKYRYKAGSFSLGIDHPSFKYRVVELFAAMRSRMTGVPFGDQGIFIRTDVFRDIGGYSNIPLMEDVELMRRLKKRGTAVKVLREKVRTSPRRWEKNGVVRNTLKNWSIQLLYSCGVSTEKLAGYYYHE